jgi:tetratricopeptide (TPR) repeat protein
MAPERFQGRADARSDVYALGLTLYELLTLRPAFDEPDRQGLLHRMMCTKPPAPRKVNPAVPRDLETIVLKAMAPDPSHRYPGAAELTADLRRFTDDKPIHARPVSEVEKLWGWCRRIPALATLAATLLLTLLLGSAGIAWKWREAEGEKQKVSQAERETANQRDQAIDARKAAQRVSAGVMLDRGVALVFSPDEKVLATGGYDGLVSLWDTTTGQRLGQPLPQGAIVLGLAFSPDGKTLAIARHRDSSGVGSVILLDVASRKPIGQPIPGPEYLLCFSPDGRHLLTAEGPTVRLWDAATGQPLGLPSFESASVSSIAFQPDGQMILSAATDGTLRLREPASGTPGGAPMPGPAQANVAVFSPDPEGRLLLAGYADGSARLWDRATRKPLGPPVLQDAPIVGASFTPDGRAFLTTASNGDTRRWPVPAPAEDDLNRLTLRLEVQTGLQMREGQIVVPLSPDEWEQGRQRRAENDSLEPPDNVPSAREFHDARARDAEYLGDDWAACWHLGQMIAALEGDPKDPSRWFAHARRAHQHALAGRLNQAEADYARALVLSSPEQVQSCYRHRVADCLKAEQWQVALWYLERAAAAGLADWTLYEDRALVHEKLGHAQEHEADLVRAVEKAIAQDAGSIFLIRLADDCVRLGRWDRAAAALSKAGEAGPLHLGVRQRHALACLKTGDRAGYRGVCARLLETVGREPSMGLANAVAWICSLGPDAVDDYTLPLALAEQAASKAQPADRHAILNTRGAVLYRAGRFREAIRCLKEGMDADRGQGNAHDWLFLAMAHQRLGETAEARRFLDRLRHLPPENGSPWDGLERELPRREAETLIDGPAAGAKK